MVVTTSGDVTWTGTSSNTLSYSTDNGTTWSTASSNITLSVNTGDKVLWKGITTPVQAQGIGTFGGTTSVRYSIEGNAMSLLFGDNFKGQTSLVGKNYAFYKLFADNTNVKSAENLSLPATTLALGCYLYMFQYCTRLTSAPELPATTLAQNCYFGMFSDCENLSSIKCLATNISARSCTDGWVRNVPAGGTFTKDASMTSWTKGPSGIPSGWTVVDAA